MPETRLTHDQLRALLGEMSARISSYVPEWTDRNDSDPGVTLVQLFAFLTEALLYRQETVSDQVQPELARLIERLNRLQPVAATQFRDLRRVRYFQGQLLSADDFQAEQDYIRSRLRRLALLVRRPGVVSGLEVRVEPDGETLSIQPGVALLPSGDEIVLCQPLSCAVNGTGEAAYVLLFAVERLSHSVPHRGSETGEATRIDEGVGVRLAAEIGSGQLAVARLVRESAGWRVDPAPEGSSAAGSIG